jgi:Fic family protein
MTRALQTTTTTTTNSNSYLEKLCQAVDLEENGDTLRDTGQVIPALRQYQRAAALEASAVGTHHLEYAALQCKIGDCLQQSQQQGDQNQQQQHKAAEEAYRIAFFIYQSALGRGHPVTKTIFKKMNAVSMC